MAASITVTPAQVQVGDQVTIDCLGFLENAEIDVDIPEYGFKVSSKSDASGEWNGTDLADKAVATLTVTGNAVAAETVTIGSVTYTWRAAPSAANEVLIGNSAAASLANLKKAVNLTGVAGTDYGAATVVNPDAGASTLTATTLLFYAKAGGTGGNALASTETMTVGSFGGTTFASGAAATGINPLVFTPTKPEPFTVHATDGTNSAKVTVPVFTE